MVFDIRDYTIRGTIIIFDKFVDVDSSSVSIIIIIM